LLGVRIIAEQLFFRKVAFLRRRRILFRGLGGVLAAMKTRHDRFLGDLRPIGYPV